MAGGVARLPLEEQRLQRRHHHKQHDRPDEHAADHDRGQRPLHLAADAGRTAAGSRPMQADSAVISIGRIRCSAAWNIASIVPMPPALTCCNR